MTDEPSQALSIEVSGSGAVSALLTTPAAAHAAYVLAHGAGAGMHHPFMAAVASGLARRGVATLRFQFPSMERASRRPDPPRVAHAAVRAAVAEANRRLGGLPLFAGGKSFGGRMTSQAQAEAPLPGVARAGLPRLPAPSRRPARRRARRAPRPGRVPDAVRPGQPRRSRRCRPDHGAAHRLGARATLAMFDDADHAFHVRARSGSNDAEVLEHLLDTVVEWIARVGAARSP